jgi:hypothetical protein
MKLIPLMTAVVLLAAPASSQGPAPALSQLKTLAKPESAAVPAATGKPVRVSEEKPKSSRYVTISGPLSLSGQAYVSQPGGWVTATLSGWLDVSDSSGRVRSRNEYVTTTASFMANGSWVNGTVWVNQYVSIYVDGKPAGSTMLNGTIFVSGWVNGSWVNLHGSGNVNGSVLVSEN